MNAYDNVIGICHSYRAPSVGDTGIIITDPPCHTAMISLGEGESPVEYHNYCSTVRPQTYYFSVRLVMKVINQRAGKFTEP